jgi:O-antigen/teichoic acid export membrane protein
MNKSIFYNTTAQLGAKLISMALTVITTILITRALGKEGYGQFSILQTLPALFFILSDFGLNATALKKMAGNDKNSHNYYQAIFTIRPLLSLLCIVVLNTVVQFLPYSPFLKVGIFMSSFWILTQALFSSTNLVFQHKQRYDLASIGYILGSVLITLMVYGFIKIGLDVRFLSFSYVVGGLIIFGINAYVLTKLGYQTSLNLRALADKTALKNLLAASLPLGLMFVFSQINFKTDAVLLSLLRLPAGLKLDNISSVAIYALPYKIFEVTLSIPTFIMNATYPVFVARFNQGRADLKKTFLKIIKLTLGLGLTASIGLYLVAPFAVHFLGGTEFIQSVSVLRILSVGLFLFFLTQPLAYLIITLDKQIYLPIIYLVGAIFNVTANLIFIPKYSFYASAYITWLSEALILVLLSFFALKAWKETARAST